MNYELISKTIDLGDGKAITLETGKLAKQADGSVMLRIGDTMILCTVVSNKDAKEGIDFLPLTVDYREKYASSGRFPGGFFKREARPSTEEILTMRLVDRALRPLFPDDYHAETQVMIALMSSDKQNIPNALVCLAASAAIAVSDIPFHGPVSEVRIARKDGKYTINPTYDELEGSELELIVAGTESSIVMVEGEMNELSEDEMVEAIEKAHTAVKAQCKAIQEFADMVPESQPKRTYSHEVNDDELGKQVMDTCYPDCKAVANKHLAKEERSEGFKAARDKYMATFSEEELLEKGDLIKKYFGEAQKKAIRDMVLETGIRLDGRKTTEIRDIWSEVDYLPGTHGSSIFTRGETQSLTTLTLGSKRDEQTIDGALFQGTENFMLHYNFPPFSTGEAYPIRGTSRREIGHGNLALRALKPIIPTGTENPYTIRIVSDILESNGSSSMATVCAGTLALMDGGVQIKAPVSGIAMGLITDGDKFAVLSDILGDEDHLGDMDFKITGTAKGITACQMDIKVEGLSFDIMEQALEQAREGRLHILDKLTQTLAQSNETVKRHAPKILKMTIGKDYIGAVIGPGGKNIQALQAETGTTVVINEEGDLGIIEILGVSPEGMDKAVASIQNTIFAPIEGETYVVKVVKMLDFGAVVEFVPKSSIFTTFTT